MTETGDQPTVRLVAHCRRCHGWLASPQSMAQGIGPTCAVREQAEQRAAAARQLHELPHLRRGTADDPVLTTEYSPDTWRQGTYRWQATPGTHTLRVRATDTTQPAQRRPPMPDGATGRHSRTSACGEMFRAPWAGSHPVTPTGTDRAGFHRTRSGDR
ncbi:DUF6011 domain-containing protein [Nocardia sp. NPDC004750]